MFGVVLWSDSQENKAVIWCEDHGDLAFYKQPGDGGHIPLDAGDWVQFDLTTDRDMRFAHNPRLVAEGLYVGLADVLGGKAPHTGQPPRQPANAAKIIPFERPKPAATERAAVCMA